MQIILQWVSFAFLSLVIATATILCLLSVLYFLWSFALTPRDRERVNRWLDEQEKTP